MQGRAKLPTIGKDVDEAMDAIEKDNPSLRGVLPKVFAQEKLDKQSLGEFALAETLFMQWFVEEAEEGWDCVKLGDIADINPTYQLKKGELSSYLEMSNVSTSTFNPEGWYEREFSSGMKFKKHL